MAITMSSVFFIKFLLYISLSLLLALKNSHAFYENQTTETQQSNLQYHTIQLSSLLPSSACKSASSQANHGKSSLKIIHKHGPCFQVNGENPRYPSLREILHQDQSRVNEIHSRLAGKISARGGTKDSKATNLPAHDGKSYDTGNYIVTVGLGTPKKDLSLVFDTGSFLTWTQCEPCVGSCYQQKEPKLDPATSQTYANVSCTASECNSHISGRGNGCKNFV